MILQKYQGTIAPQLIIINEKDTTEPEISKKKQVPTKMAKPVNIEVPAATDSSAINRFFS